MRGLDELDQTSVLDGRRHRDPQANDKPNGRSRHSNQLSRPGGRSSIDGRQVGRAVLCRNAGSVSTAALACAKIIRTNTETEGDVRRWIVSNTKNGFRHVLVRAPRVMSTRLRTPVVKTWGKSWSGPRV